MTVANSSQIQVVGSQVPQWVPRESVRQQPETKPSLSYREYLLGLTRIADEDDQPAELLRHRKWLTCLRFAEGRQLGYINSRTGLWTDVVREDGDPIYIANGKSKAYQIGKDVFLKPYYSPEIAKNQKTYQLEPYCPGYKFKYTGQLDQFIKIYSTGARQKNMYLSLIISYFNNMGIKITEETTLKELIELK